MLSVLAYSIIFVLTASLTVVATLLLQTWVYGLVGRELREARRVRAYRERSVRAVLMGSSFAVGGLSVGLGIWMGRPYLGLLGFLGLLWILPALRRWRTSTRWAELDASGLIFFHGLSGLTQAGMSLPDALFRLGHLESGPFSSGLGDFLKKFSTGKPLVECLSRFRGRASAPDSRVPLVLLELIYREGLPAKPLLENLLPRMEAERLQRARALDVRKAAMGQAVLAALLPWGLLAAMSLFQPEMIARFIGGPMAPPALVGVVLVEGLGVFAVWRISEFA